MRAILHNVRERPVRVRRRITLIASLALTGIIMVIWLFTFSLQGRTPPTGTTIAETQPGPLGSIGQAVRGVVDDLKGLRFTGFSN